MDKATPIDKINHSTPTKKHPPDITDYIHRPIVNVKEMVEKFKKDIKRGLTKDQLKRKHNHLYRNYPSFFETFTGTR
jgi:hypothetical protein